MTADLLTADPESLVSLRDVERVLVRQMKALQGPGPRRCSGRAWPI